MGTGYRCVCFPLQREQRKPDEFLGYLKRLGLSPIWSRGHEVEYNPLLGSLDETGKVLELVNCRDAVEKLQDRDLEIALHNEKEGVIFRIGVATEPDSGRFAMHWTSGRSEKRTLYAWMQKCEVSLPDLCAAFAHAVGAKSFSFESVGHAIRSIAGEIDREYFEDGSGVFKSYPLCFAGLPDDSTDYFTDYVKRKLAVPQSYVTANTSLGDVYCLALGKDHASGEECTLSDGMGKTKITLRNL